VNDPHRDVGAPTFTAGHDPACDDAGLLRRIGQGDEDAMGAFYREHGRVVFAQVPLVVTRVNPAVLASATVPWTGTKPGGFTALNGCPTGISSTPATRSS
jgi:hypothetical protein